MKRIRPLRKPHAFTFLVIGVVAAVSLLAAVSVRSEQNPAARTDGQTAGPAASLDHTLPAGPPQKATATKSSLDRTKDDAAQLSALADKLRDELNKMNVNVFSLDVLQKTEQVEKLARKIKGEATKE